MNPNPSGLLEDLLGPEPVEPVYATMVISGREAVFFATNSLVLQRGQYEGF